MVSRHDLNLPARLARLAACALLALGVPSTGAAAPTEAAVAPTDRVASLRHRLAHPRSGDTIVIAHRSCWDAAPENSIAAVQACIRMGVDGIEFDVRHSKDGVAVVIHDDTVDRTTNGHGKVSDLTLAELKALRLKPRDGLDGGALTVETLPTLEEFLAVAKGHLLLVFDVKDLTQQESFAIAKRMGVDRQAIYFYECSNDLLLKQVRPFWNEVFVFPITFGDGPPLSRSMGACPSNPTGMVHAKFDTEATLTAPGTASALKGKRVWVMTVQEQDVAGHADAPALRDPDAHWGWLLRAGVNMIMTNEPQALMAYLKRRPRA